MAIGTTYEFVNKHLASEVARGFRVLETGCGAAFYRKLVEEQGALYLGTDVPNRHYGNLQSVDSFCSADQLPFRDETFDLLFNQGAIDYMPNLSMTLGEAYRVLAPGGRMIIYTYRKDILENIHRNVSASQKDWEIHHHVFSAQQLLGYLTQAGFVARDISFDLNTWNPIGIVKKMLEISGLYSALNRQRTIWRIFLAIKAK